MALEGVTDHVLDLLVGAVDDDAAAILLGDDLAIVELRLRLVVVRLAELIDGHLERRVRRIHGAVVWDVDDVQRAHGATTCCMPLGVGLPCVLARASVRLYAVTLTVRLRCIWRNVDPNLGVYYVNEESWLHTPFL